MAKAQKKKINEPISISKIYETIKARDFLQELWWDLISDIKEKPTYKRMKEMVSSLINDAIKDFSTEPCSDAERLKRRTMLTEISIMTYTVDTVISEVLFRKLQNEFQMIIANMINDLKAESIARTTGARQLKQAKVENIQNADVAKTHKDGRNEARLQSQTLSQTSPEMPAATPNSSAKPGRPRKLNPAAKSGSSASLTSTPQPKKRGRPLLSPSKRLVNKIAEKKSPPLSKSLPRSIEKASISFSNSLVSNGIKTEVDDINQESDAESTVSDGNLSMTSVSSVHTSELSSFEDTISIDGDEESGQKKQIPLKVANDMYLQGTLSQIYEMGKKKKRQRKGLSATYSASSKSVEHVNSLDSSPSLRKVLPQRVRKPNSKYNSETIICEAYPTTTSTPKVNHVSPISPRQKRQKTLSNDDKIEKSNVVNSSPVRSFSSSLRTPSSRVLPTANMSSNPSSTQRYNASDLYKPRSAFNSSRGSPAFTLFTTLNQ